MYYTIFEIILQAHINFGDNWNVIKIILKVKTQVIINAKDMIQ